MAYKPLYDYGLIGNMRSAALVGRDGAIDWLCLPAFDSPSVFAAILDERKGGTFRVWTDGGAARATQEYWPGTNVLLTRLRDGEAIAELTDFMPVRVSSERDRPPDLVRLIEAVSGPVQVKVHCRPQFDYARATAKIEACPGGVIFRGPGVSLALRSSFPLEIDGDAGTALLRLSQGSKAAIAIQHLTGERDECASLSVEHAWKLRDETLRYWRHWLKSCTYHGRWREVIERSALMLKLLTYEPTGAIIAAPTCSLPERIGGDRNWDYRYTWLRDASFTVYALMRIGFWQEAAQFMSWLHERAQEREPNGALRPLYRIDGTPVDFEEELPHLEGYRGSRPVRIGNAAGNQLQLDVNGALLDAAYLHNKHAVPLSYGLWQELTQIVDWVCDNWRLPDDGIWEVRSGRQDFVFSKLMCWVALDRGVRLAQKRSFPADLVRWRGVRDEIYREIMERGWNAERETFVQHYDTDALDAANLLMPLVFFIAPNDERMLSTISAIRRPLSSGGLLDDFHVRRYDPQRSADGVGGEEGSFNMCTFWLIEALTRAGRAKPELLEEAEILFARMLSCASPLKLYAEELDDNGEALGNYPQAFTHLALISAAFNLNRRLNGT